MDKKELGIYIHIPYCKQKCYYCDFISYTNPSLLEQYVKAIIQELEKYDLNNYNVTTIYIGGGTPSYIKSEYIVKILNFIKQKLLKSNNQTKFEDIEITIEVNPGTVDRKKLEDYINCGINRLSIGLQTTNNILLKQIGRIHTYEEFLETYKLATDIGFKNINIDLMLGLPNQTINDLKNSLNDIIKLNPNHISVYSLIIEEGTKINDMLTKGELKLPNEEIERQMYWYVKDKLELNGYNHYEISNFAKKGKESKHNVNCWKQKEYIGIGVAGHSYLDGIRYANCLKVEDYIENMNNLKDALKEIKNAESNIYEIEEIQSLNDKKKEFMLLGLRMIDGICISEFKERYVDNPIFLYRKELEKLVDENLIVIDGDNIRLTSKGLDFANLVWEEFV